MNLLKIVNELKLNNNQILIIKSNLFSNLNEKFDLITFNPPYVPTTNNLGNNNYPNIRFSGSDGLKTTKEFLKMHKIIYLQLVRYYLGLILLCPQSCRYYL